MFPNRKKINRNNLVSCCDKNTLIMERESSSVLLIEGKERKHVSVFLSNHSFCSHQRLTNVDTYANRTGLQIIQSSVKKTDDSGGRT